ncbi:MAG TPA: hypothetical protein VNH64_05355 [Parvularculaceae bacterium]|nr:hypothetical protein [Parvularculaceae bacterium]
MKQAGYSGTPLAEKLGYKQGMTAFLINAPKDYARLIHPAPEDVVFRARPGRNLGLAHLFVRRRSDLEKRLKPLIAAIRPAGMIWVSWPKKSSKVETDVTEDVVRDVALPLGLVDVKVCAVDDIWSALKLVLRKEKR